jgi:hypothetical protein
LAWAASSLLCVIAGDLPPVAATRRGRTASGGEADVIALTGSGRGASQRRAKPAPRDADASGMLTEHGPMSNAERQAKFRAGHPGYNRRYRRKLSAQRKRELHAAAARAAAAARVAAAGVAAPQAEVSPVTWMAA